jgi:hypothetical protein
MHALGGVDEAAVHMLWRADLTVDHVNIVALSNAWRSAND